MQSGVQILGIEALRQAAARNAREKLREFGEAGNKVQQLPVPKSLSIASNGIPNELAAKLFMLSHACWQRGQKLAQNCLRTLFETSNEAYEKWNSELPGHVVSTDRNTLPIDSLDKLRESYALLRRIREMLSAEMIALQEEMDWLVYAAYGLLNEDHPTKAEPEPESLLREHRPFVLWANANGDYEAAVEQIPSDWSRARKKLWEARLSMIRDSKHIRRIEQPIYKRRWDEQWKVGNQWRCGPVAYAAEFADAFEWWLREKAEWWLEHKKNGEPTEFEHWAEALWNDARVKAAWPVAAEEYARLECEKARETAEVNGDPVPGPTLSAADFTTFKQKFREVVDEETVPEGFPFGTSYDDLEKKLRKSIPAKLSKVRGKLNVPRERFHLRDKTQYLWAGLQFKQ